MCLRLIYHNLACDVRPRVSRGANGGAIVDPYTTPKPCPGSCPGKEHIAPYFRCLKHKCCLTSTKYASTTCRTRCKPEDVIDYHVYDQWMEGPKSKQAQALLTLFSPQNTAHANIIQTEIEEWEKLPTIDSYIPKLGIAVSISPEFRAWRTALLSKAAHVYEVLHMMDLVEERLAMEYQREKAEQDLHQRLQRDWEKYRRYPTEPQPKKSAVQDNRKSRLWETLNKLASVLKTAEGEYQALQTPSLPFKSTDTSLITSLAPVQNHRPVHANWGQGYRGEMKDTLHQMMMFQF